MGWINKVSRKQCKRHMGEGLFEGNIATMWNVWLSKTRRPCMFMCDNANCEHLQRLISKDPSPKYISCTFASSMMSSALSIAESTFSRFPTTTIFFFNRPFANFPWMKSRTPAECVQYIAPWDLPWVKFWFCTKTHVWVTDLASGILRPLLSVLLATSLTIFLRPFSRW